MLPNVELSGATGFLVTLFVAAAVVAVLFTASVTAALVVIVVVAIALLLVYGLGARLDQLLRGGA